MGIILETSRLILRGWQDNDAASLFKLASDERVGMAAGWPAHESVGYSRAVIRTIFNKKEVYAICLKGGNDEPVGSIGLTLTGSRERPLMDGDAELGYWVGVPFWGRGIATEAACEIIRHGFEDIKLRRIFCCYFDGNVRSKRVQEKCGFVPYAVNENTYIPILKETRKEYVNVMCAPKCR
ncbi:Protein N-acetyltransferase, RimJ/RimL family [Butyrivibrio proteoclasticus]|uniref:Protein N-acetyltransferase, RimJ/RimL family n=1 Tax=Butyrivibrio proteoclasticus TaxID=43305 RepID=A0A1I5R4L2_9FIRM|nr:GNAT family N-acetyltransferase [Butyrivibrio proteoclasticus]SFP53504.1 Protein N-acetyltransferase, RimJ/RimL family [Butyrivibrio proteoclasticus]